MANGFDSSKITRQLRSPRNLLEFADVSIQPRQSTTAEVIANTLDDAFERASQTYLQGKQLDAQVQQQQIQSDLRREQINVQQRQFQANQDRATDNVLMESLKDINLKTEAGRTEARATIGEISDARLARIFGSRLDASISSADKLSRYEEQFQGKDINEILTGTFTVNGEEKTGKRLLDEYMAISPTGSGIFGVSKDKMLTDMTAKYRGSSEYFNFAYGKYENDEGEMKDKLDRLGFNEAEKEEFRALSPNKGMEFLTNKLSEKGVDAKISAQLRNLENSIGNRNRSINILVDQQQLKGTDKPKFDKLELQIKRFKKEIAGYDSQVDSLYRKMGLTVTSSDNQNNQNNQTNQNNQNNQTNQTNTTTNPFEREVELAVSKEQKEAYDKIPESKIEFTGSDLKRLINSNNFSSEQLNKFANVYKKSLNKDGQFVANTEALKVLKDIGFFTMLSQERNPIKSYDELNLDRDTLRQTL